MPNPTESILSLASRRRLLHTRLRGMSNANWREQLRAELREVEILICEADAARLLELRERLTPGEYDDGYCRPFGGEGQR